MAEIFIYDEIGPEWWGLVSAKSVIDQLNQTYESEEVVVRLNSPGGVVTDAWAIYNALTRRPGRTVVEIDALAASAASYIAMAGDEINMAENAMMMIHNAWTHVGGDAEELRKVADTLDKYTTQAATGYAKRSGLTVEKVEQLMSDETWMNADEAADLGFVDSVNQPQKKVSANIREGHFPNQPKDLARGLFIPESVERWMQERGERADEWRRSERRKRELRLLKVQ